MKDQKYKNSLLAMGFSGNESDTIIQCYVDLEKWEENHPNPDIPNIGDFLKGEIEAMKKFGVVVSPAWYLRFLPKLSRAKWMLKKVLGMSETDKLRNALQEIIETGLCNLPHVRCDHDMFEIAYNCLNPEEKE